ncbi:uncharacterized protein LOC127546495 [Antechinus flavipes]|uniref:uncharacterized protein LOC127546495 n=1 Tax=Antechinus flavipes TaxID=38775 RepID=UPI0022364277|nr:uncharacterized protein LOC127546495 [Antechinus flavipes]
MVRGNPDPGTGPGTAPGLPSGQTAELAQSLQPASQWPPSRPPEHLRLRRARVEKIPPISALCSSYRSGRRSRRSCLLLAAVATAAADLARKLSWQREAGRRCTEGWRSVSPLLLLHLSPKPRGLELKAQAALWVPASPSPRGASWFHYRDGFQEREEAFDSLFSAPSTVCPVAQDLKGGSSVVLPILENSLEGWGGRGTLQVFGGEIRWLFPSALSGVQAHLESEDRPSPGLELFVCL